MRTADRVTVDEASGERLTGTVRPPRQRAVLTKLWVIAAVALAAFAVTVAPNLPPVDQDEYLPVFPMTWFRKVPEARSAMLRGYSRVIRGHQLPVRAYPYEGAVKAYFYHATSLPASVAVYRTVNLALLWVFVAVLVWACFRISGRSLAAAACCLALFLSDVSSVVLGITAVARISSLIFAVWLVGLLYSIVERPRWWKILPVALVTFLGEWDKVNFLWFVAAGLAGTAAACLTHSLGGAAGRLTLAVLGCALGLAGAGWLIPDYVVQARGGMTKSIGLFDFPALWAHWCSLFQLLDPVTSFHRYANINVASQTPIYAAYRWAFVALYLAVIGAAGMLGVIARWRRSEGARGLLFASACLATLLAVIVKTPEAWAAHHMMFVKPFLCLGLGVLVGHLGGSRIVTACWVLVAIASAYVGARGFRDLLHAPSTLGYYDVSWNAVDAWRAATRSEVPNVYALDWGVFYPGVANSRADQSWEMGDVPSADALQRLEPSRRGFNVGLLFKSSGPNHWLLEPARGGDAYSVVHREAFHRYPGEGWVFQVVNASAGRRAVRAPAPGSAAEADAVSNGAFVDGLAHWQLERFGPADVGVVDCDAAGVQRCARLQHSADADSRLVQDVELAPRTVYEISALGRAEGVGEAHRGVYLCLMDSPGESEELKGTTDWQPLRFHIANPTDAPTRVRLALRLGGFGSMNTGTARFTRIAARRVPPPPPGVVVYVAQAPS